MKRFPNNNSTTSLIKNKLNLDKISSLLRSVEAKVSMEEEKGNVTLRQAVLNRNLQASLSQQARQYAVQNITFRRQRRNAVSGLRPCLDFDSSSSSSTNGGDDRTMECSDDTASNNAENVKPITVDNTMSSATSLDGHCSNGEDNHTTTTTTTSTTSISIEWA
jgi:hypothetical protein